MGPIENYLTAKAITGRAGLYRSRYQSDQGRSAQRRAGALRQSPAARHDHEHRRQCDAPMKALSLSRM